MNLKYKIWRIFIEFDSDFWKGKNWGLEVSKTATTTPRPEPAFPESWCSIYFRNLVGTTCYRVLLCMHDDYRINYRIIIIDYRINYRIKYNDDQYSMIRD